MRMSLSMLRRTGVAAVILTGIALFGSALQGVTRVDGALELAASRAAPERALVQETAADRWDCPSDDPGPPV